MKYQVGDLIDEYDNVGLGYIVSTTNGICIFWFSVQTEYVYNDHSVDNWIINKSANHYPVVKQ